MKQKSFLNKCWQYPEVEADQAKILSEKFDIPEQVSSLLLGRNLKDENEIYDFLHPVLKNLPSPYSMKGMENAIEIIVQGFKENAPFIIYGDYDVDGVTGVALLARFSKIIGLNFICCHPNRFDDGYGLKADVVKNAGLIEKGVIITVDCGISDIEEVAKLKDEGWRVIITDHHQPPEKLPNADAVINPWQDDCSFEFKDLSGVGVAFFLIMGLRSYLIKKNFWINGNEPNLKVMLDLVAVGTISDMVPLVGVNRILVKAGLEVLKNTENIGLQELISHCNIPFGQAVTTEDISYLLGPRLNAAGRMGDPVRASVLLSTDNVRVAKQMADSLEEENNLRKNLTLKVYEKAKEVAQKYKDDHCIVLHGEDWHQGLIGIVTSKVVELYHKPVIVFSGENKLKGSARSVPGVNIYETLLQCKEHMIEFGGHSGAAGLSIYKENLESLRIKINTILEKENPEKDYREEIEINFIDEQLPFEDFVKHEKMLQPYGQGNPEPVFSTRDYCGLRNIKAIGKDKKHLRFSAYVFGAWVNGIGFGFGDIINEIQEQNKNVRIAFTIKDHRYKWQTQKQIHLQDVIIEM